MRPYHLSLLLFRQGVDARNIGVRKHAVLWTAMCGHDGEFSHMLSCGNSSDFSKNRTLTAS
jgi:hypothetical protein